MDANNQSMMVEGANPDMLWIQHIDYLATQSKIMKKEYIRRKRANKPFTWNDLDVMNKKIHHDLDVVMSGVENVQENKQNTNMNKKLIRLTESDLHKIVKESVGKILKETSDNFDSNLDEGVYLSAGWLSDILEAIDKEERIVSMNSQQPQLRAEGMRMALEIIKDHI